MSNSKNGGRNLTDVMRDMCRARGIVPFTSYEIYAMIMDVPKKNGRRRHYTLTYSEVKQRLARADYVEKIIEGLDEDGRTKVARYRNIPERLS
jgi:hypothetical protein